ncbi:MAG: hypothetical protein QMD09_15275, partial [Desulfatibacillaceae bacterium]|nr:hypothetical protein [Desulfatibacillaceae bacterium]
CGMLVGKDPGEGKGCATCESFVLMGSKLRKARFVVETQNGSIHPLEELNDSKLVAKSRRICCLNSFDMGTMAKAIKDLDPQPVLAARLMGVRTPVDPEDEEVTPFDELAERSEGDKNHIAILRADVDSLGELFKQQEGLMELAAMSLALSDFFEGWITALLRRENYQDSTYLIYAGGDDLFVVGAWNSALDAARTISIEYDRFSCGKSSLSAGVEVVHKRYPLKKSAELAGEAERMAKDFRPEKNTICFLGTALPWEDMASVKQLVNRIAGAVEKDKKASRGFIRRIFEIWRVYEAGKSELEKAGKQGADLAMAARWQRWRWMLVYGLRNDLGEEGQAIQNEFLEEKMEPYLGLTARWAQLATRRN